MCRFHSFVMTQALDFLEKPGEVHHSCIASRQVVDRSLLPEFDVVRRQVHFDHVPLLNALTERPERAVSPLSRRGGARIYSGVDRFLSQEALDALENYLWKRFGTRERFVEFVEPWWEAGKDELSALTPSARFRSNPGSFRLPPPAEGAPSIWVGSDQIERAEAELTTLGGTRWLSVRDERRRGSVHLRIVFAQSLLEGLGLSSGAYELLQKLMDRRAAMPAGSERCLVMALHVNPSRCPLLWAGPLRISESHHAENLGPHIELAGPGVLASQGSVRGLTKDVSAQIYEADRDVVDSLLGGFTYEKWSSAMLNGACIQEWKRDLDLDYALGFRDEHVYAHSAR